MVMPNIPVTPCNCISVDSAAIACLIVSCLVHFRRHIRSLRIHQLLFPRQQSSAMQHAADAVITCDVVKLSIGLVLVHGFLFVHEAIVSDGGQNETKYFFLIHLARAFIDIVLVSALGHIFWMHVVVRYVNHLISRGSVEERSSVFFSALRASGRYNSSYGLNWGNDDSMDLRVDATEAPVPELGPSVLDQRVQRRQLVEAAYENRDDDNDADDTDDPRAHLNRQVAANPYEPNLTWWRHQTVVWCGILFFVSTVVVGLQLVWRELLGTNDPLLYALTKFTDAVDGSGDFVCGGQHDGELLQTPPTDTIVALSWMALLLFHFVLATGTLVVLHQGQKYKGRVVHAAHAVN